MKKPLKIIAIIAVLALLIMLGLAVFINTYFTDERLRAMLLPPVQKAVGREVTVGNLKVSLFTGIKLYDVQIKEEDGKGNFFSSNRFILSYDLLPLLQKQLVIKEIRLVEPQINVTRDKKGVFNFSTLAFLNKEKAKEDKKEEPAAPGPAQELPLGITVERLQVENAQLTVSDATGAIPATSVKSNLNVSLDLSGGLENLSFKGESDFAVNTDYQGVKPTINGRLNFTKKRLSYDIDLALAEDQVKLSGAMEDYLQKGKIPPIALNISSKELDLTRIQKATAGLKKDKGKKSSSAPSKGGKKDDKALNDLRVEGMVEIASLRHNKAEMRDLNMAYQLANGVLTCRDLKTATMGGEVRGEMQTALAGKQTFKGKMGLHSLQLPELHKAFFSNKAGTYEGAIDSAFTFSGTGFSKKKMEKNLHATGDMSLTGGRFQGTDFTRSLSALLNLPELDDMKMDKMDGRFTISKGRLQVDSSGTSNHLSAQTTGSMGLDGSLAMPLTLTLSPKLSGRLEERLEVAKYLEKKGDQTVIPLDLKGTLKKPRLTMNESYLKRRATDTLIDKLTEDDDPAKKEAGKAIKGVLDNLFGK
ncbi:MAG: AsmA family protein [Thermodesulfobacteriota bacterium]